MALKEIFSKKKDKNKMVIIGLDGAPYHLILNLTNTGKMPFLSEILKEGSCVEMKSSIPPVSSVAWSTFMTGVNPGKHGIFGFIDLKNNSYEPYFPNFTHLKAPTIWDLIASHKKRTIAINIPQTYPAREINGILISGFVAINLEKAVYPLSIYPKLKEMDYRIDVAYEEAADKKEEFFTDLYYTLKKRGEAFQILLKHQEWDLFIGVFTESDRLHHYFWDEYENPQGNYHHRFINYYIKLDNIIGELIECLPTGSHLLIMADHGFCRLKEEFYPNVWLKERGYLKFKKEPPSSILDIHPETKAFILDPGRLYINLKGRMPNGCVEPGKSYEEIREELKEGLMKICSPLNSTPVLENVYLKEELYSGPYLSQAPDLILQGKAGFDIKGSLNKDSLFGKGKFSGMHTYPDAFLYLRGKELSGDCSIVDLAPSIFQLFEIPSPNHFDGKPL